MAWWSEKKNDEQVAEVIQFNPAHKPPRPSPPPPDRDELRRRLLRAQSIFIQESLLYTQSYGTGKTDISRYMWAQSDFIRAQSAILRRMGML